jgi:hypothetical protein
MDPVDFVLVRADDTEKLNRAGIGFHELHHLPLPDEGILKIEYQDPVGLHRLQSEVRECLKRAGYGKLMVWLAPPGMDMSTEPLPPGILNKERWDAPPVINLGRNCSAEDVERLRAIMKEQWNAPIEHIKPPPMLYVRDHDGPLYTLRCPACQTPVRVFGGEDGLAIYVREGDQPLKVYCCQECYKKHTHREGA